VPTVFRTIARHHDLVALADADLVIATRAAVRLFRLIRLDVTDLDTVSGFGPAMHAHNAITVSPRHHASMHRAAERRRGGQAAGSGEREPPRASSTFARSGSRIRRSQAPCHSQAAPHPGHDSTTEPPDQASASIGMWSYGHWVSSTDLFSAIHRKS
jgi:hypothetical protein